MKNIYKNITVGFLVVLIFVSTMGFSINTLYCFCMGQYEVSLFNIEHTCSKPHENTEIETHACCKKLKAHCSKPSVKDTHDCAKKDSKFVKADLKFLEYSKIELPKQPLFVAIFPSIFENYPFTFSNIIHLNAEIPTRPPPQYFGRSLLNFIQVYRC